MHCIDELLDVFRVVVGIHAVSEVRDVSLRSKGLQHFLHMLPKLGLQRTVGMTLNNFNTLSFH